jgi:hypothetical protein
MRQNIQARLNRDPDRIYRYDSTGIATEYSDNTQQQPRQNIHARLNTIPAKYTGKNGQVLRKNILARLDRDRKRIYTKDSTWIATKYTGKTQQGW